MKDADWGECLESSNAIQRSPDRGKANSLLHTAEDRIRFLRSIPLTDDNAPFIFEAYYSSVLEVMHALLNIKGFRVDNHICLGYYIRDEIQRPDLYRSFDSCRKDRNSLVYYGSRLDPEIAKDNIKKMEKMMAELKRLIRESQDIRH